MTDADKARNMLGTLLQLTRETEMDCDEFGKHVAELAEGTVDPQLRALLDHHREICPECEEELRVLAQALDLDPKSS